MYDLQSFRTRLFALPSGCCAVAGRRVWLGATGTLGEYEPATREGARIDGPLRRGKTGVATPPISSCPAGSRRVWELVAEVDEVIVAAQGCVFAGGGTLCWTDGAVMRALGPGQQFAVDEGRSKKPNDERTNGERVRRLRADPTDRVSFFCSFMRPLVLPLPVARINVSASRFRVACEIDAPGSRTACCGFGSCRTETSAPAACAALFE